MNAEDTDPDDIGWRSGYAIVGGLALLAMLGFVVGHVVMHAATDGTASSAAYVEMPEFTIHGGIIAAQVGLWFAAFPVLLWQQRALRRHFGLRVSWRSVVPGVAGVLAVLVVPFTLNRPGEEYPLAHAELRTNVLYLLAVPLIAASVFVLDAVDRAARGPGWSDELAGRRRWDTDDLAELQAAARGVLALLGAAVSLVVFATGGLFNAIDAYAATSSDGGAAPSNGLLLVYGALLVVALGVLYAPAHRAIGRASEALLARAAPLPGDAAAAGDRAGGAALRDVLETRAALRRSLGVDTDLRGALERGVVILSPLISGVVTLFLTGRS
jgi:hypothetical protein